ncbi:MAG: TrbC/VirB2 family protein [Erythrobacter sp.]
MQSFCLGSSVDWIDGLVFGPMALTLCMLAVAFVGFVMLTGRMPVRHGLSVALGCFVLIGAPVIASGLMELGQERIAPAAPPVAASEQPRQDLPPPNDDLFSGASSRRG